MSTAGNFGERQSWRRGNDNAAGKRRTTKAVLTLIAALLLALFLYILLRPKPDRNLVTVMISPSYNLDIVTPGLYAESVRNAVREQLGAEVFDDSSQTIRSRFQDTTKVAKYFSDKDDTLMVVIRGYLLEDANGDPAIACSDLGFDPTSLQPVGLLKLSEILAPLASQAPESFTGSRLVVLDVEPLAAHPALGQSNESVFAKLETLVRSLDGPAAEHVWVLSTRGPLQNPGWDPAAKMPIASEALLDGIGGEAELDGDGIVTLPELCGYLGDRYSRLPRRRDDAPQVLLLRGGQGTVTLQDDAISEVWINYATRSIASDTDTNDEAQEPAESQPAAEDTASANTATGISPRPGAIDLSIRTVAFQADNAGTNTDAAESPVETAPGDSASQPTGPPANQSPALANGATPGNESTPIAETFWDFRDRFEAVPFELGSGNRGEENAVVSPLALAPQLWRQLTLKVLAAELQSLDASAPQSSTQLAQIVVDDLKQLQNVLLGKSTNGSINDDLIRKMRDFVESEQRRQRSQRRDRRLTVADELQHAIAAAYNRLWALSEFERQAIVAGTEAPTTRLLSVVKVAESVIGSASGGQSPSQAEFDRQRRDLFDSLDSFDRNVDQSIGNLLNEFSRNDPERTWELVRTAYAWLRSPLPSAKQRRQLYQAITSAPVDSSDRVWREVNVANVRLAKTVANEADRQRVSQYEMHLAEFNAAPDPSIAAERDAAWQLRLATEMDAEFGPRMAAILRVDPRLGLLPVNQTALLHRVTAEPIVRRPNVAIVDANGTPLTGDAAVILGTSNDSQTLNLKINPDRPSATRLLLSYAVRSTASSFRDPPVNVDFSIPGQSGIEPDQTVDVSIAADRDREIPVRITAQGVAEPNESLVLEIRIRGDRTSDQVEGVVGTYEIPIELPAENRLIAIASNYRGIGCSVPTESGQGNWPAGMWLRTFNDRKTPFQLSLKNEAGKACRAKVWLVRLPSPMPQDVRAYWPDFAQQRYSDPADGRVLDNDGRIEDRFLRPERILMGPAVIGIPADRQPVPVSFRPSNPAQPDAPPPAPPSQPAVDGMDISHGMALVCRLVDEKDQPLADKDQVIYLVAKPWAPHDYLDTQVSYEGGRVEVNARLLKSIDGDQTDDEIPEIATRPITVTWLEDDQWESFQPGTSKAPDSRPLRLRGTAGEPVGFISVPVDSRSNRTWVQLDVDGWPRAISSVVEHQSGSLGQSKTRNSIKFGLLRHLKRSAGDQESDPEKPGQSIFAPRREVYFQGGGAALRTTLQADFFKGDFTAERQPQLRFEVEGRPYATYLTDRIVKTELAEATLDGVVTLKTTVTDISEDLPQGQYATGQVPLNASLLLGGREVETTAINAIFDSSAPNWISVRPASSHKGPLQQGTTVPFTISARDEGRLMSGIRTIEYGLDTTGDGQANTQRGSYTFDPPVTNDAAMIPVARTAFKFPLAQHYHIVVRATDASGNSFESQEPIQVVKSSEGAVADGMTTPKAAPKKGWLHGTINTGAGMSGDLTLSPAPRGVNMKSKFLSGTDRSFNFGVLPEGEYTLKFSGSISNRSRTLTWEGLKIDTSAGKANPVALEISQAKSE
ncbi:hypothetical protein [Rhodopirellula sp. MGV]|uniref:hypothetical protein n=1 Tax=Rhodopirellula sp. MGV TaxID=2023130 RepID=UPI000B96A425|nr:hypothetical protein [Rhodopirellula sp. MGV]OYP35466.1 hypothetical protein CGZ80_11530 [Rhodopirellula sp. MGV]PNY33907.1 hypothetical protein C2E31_26160 [Rhodopirellula baltica]